MCWVRFSTSTPILFIDSSLLPSSTRSTLSKRIKKKVLEVPGWRQRWTFRKESSQETAVGSAGTLRTRWHTNFLQRTNRIASLFSGEFHFPAAPSLFPPQFEWLTLSQFSNLIFSYVTWNSSWWPLTSGLSHSTGNRGWIDSYFCELDSWVGRNQNRTTAAGEYPSL